MTVGWVFCDKEQIGIYFRKCSRPTAGLVLKLFSNGWFALR